MKGFALTAAAVAATATTSFAGGIDRSGQDVSILFEEGNYVKLNFASVAPDVPSSMPGFASQSATDYITFSLGIKMQVNEKLSFTLIADEPFGADIRYADGALSALAPLPDPNARAIVDSRAITGLLRYEFGNGFSIHGGVRAQKVKGEILSGDGFLTAESKFDFGGVAGVAYEIPDIALRVALTYNTQISHDLTGLHNFAATTGNVTIPQSFNLDFQTGIAENTLLFGSVRHVSWAGTTLSTNNGGGDTDWVQFVDDSTSFELGLGRKLNDNWSVALIAGYEEGAETGTTFLAPTGTSKSIGLGATYTKDNFKISGGVRYVSFDEKVVNGVPFDGNAVAAGISLGISF